MYDFQRQPGLPEEVAWLILDEAYGGPVNEAMLEHSPNLRRALTELRFAAIMLLGLHFEELRKQDVMPELADLMRGLGMVQRARDASYHRTEPRRIRIAAVRTKPSRKATRLLRTS